MDGVFTRAQAYAAGYSEYDVRRFVRDGRWARLRHGVFVEAARLAEVAGCPRRRYAMEVAAALLRVTVDTVAGGPSAARILGIALLGRCPPDPVLVTGADVKGMRRNGIVLRHAALPSAHVTTRLGVAVTSPARTVVDLARTQPFRAGVVAADSALHGGIVSLADLESVIRDCSSWPGIGRAREVVAFGESGAESPLESISRVAMREQGLPMPRTQVTLGDGLVRYCVDFLWDDFRVVGEADGLGKYEPSGGRSTGDIVRAEKRREEWLADEGFEVVRWGWDDAWDSARLARRLRAAFARGAARRRDAA